MLAYFIWVKQGAHWGPWVRLTESIVINNAAGICQSAGAVVNLFRHCMLPLHTLNMPQSGNTWQPCTTLTRFCCRVLQFPHGLQCKAISQSVRLLALIKTISSCKKVEVVALVQENRNILLGKVRLHHYICLKGHLSGSLGKAWNCTWLRGGIRGLQGWLSARVSGWWQLACETKSTSVENWNWIWHKLEESVWVLIQECIVIKISDTVMTS